MSEFNNIKITPNIGVSSDPKIEFTGAGNSTVTLKVLDSADGTIKFEGQSGDMLTIIDTDITSSLPVFSANDYYGVPLIEAYNTGNVVITPYGGQTATINGTLTCNNTSTFNENIFISKNAKIGSEITIIPYDTLSNGTLSFEGSAGQLFSISNNLTSGSIFSVNDVSGIPSIDVDADGTISLAPYSGVVVLKQVSETVANAFDTALAPSSGTLTINTALGTVVLGDINASVTTWAFTNVPTGNSLATTITVIINGDTAQTYGDACSVNGTAVTDGIKWAGGSAPSASNNFDIITFTIIKDSAGTVNVFGSATMNYS